MKKLLLFSLMGAIILFVWQFLSFAFPNLHKSASAYTTAQDSIMKIMDEMKVPEGMYWLNQPDPTLSRNDQEKWMEKNGGKPWAVINYRKTNMMDMTMPMIRGFLVNFVISMLLFWLFLQQLNPSLLRRIYLALAVGIITFLFMPYTGYIWYKEPDIFAYFLDGIAPWLLLGWIGHLMIKPKKVAATE